MSSENKGNAQTSYEKDSRIPCQYGAECYQKNPFHQSKYKHPPKNGQNGPNNLDAKITSQTKRKAERKRKVKYFKKLKHNSTPEKNSPINTQRNLHNISPSSSTSDIIDSESEVSKDSFKELDVSTNADHEKMSEETVTQEDDNCDRLNNKAEILNIKEETLNNQENMLHNQEEKCDLDHSNASRLIEDLFLTKMPSDFYKFYELCELILKGDPSNAFKSIQLVLVGPYDILNKKLEYDHVDKEKYLKHWRYYYDPPEFQTVIKGNDKEGLHFGYWRDSLSEKPVFVGKNKATVNCIIESVAENIFGAVDCYIEDRLKRANPFEKTSIIGLQRHLKQFAKNNNITLDRNTANMKTREKNVVARTFHKAGIVVPYDKKTQLGYRDLAATDNALRKILDDIEKAVSSHEKQVHMSKLEEIRRLATIAADECDFGTCLELGHDLFASGGIHVQNIALQMLSTAYTLLERPDLLRILKIHLADRKKGCDLSVI